MNPLYFLPGNDNVTVQLTLFNFQSQFNTRWNLLFADVLLITIPPLIMFIFFQRQIVSGMTAGAVRKGDGDAPTDSGHRSPMPGTRRGPRGWPRPTPADLASVGGARR